MTRLCAVLGTVADLKSVYLIGHSARVARMAAAAAEHAELTGGEITQIEIAAHLHNLGCVVVPSSLLDRSASPDSQLGTADRERLRLQGY